MVQPHLAQDRQIFFTLPYINFNIGCVNRASLFPPIEPRFQLYFVDVEPLTWLMSMSYVTLLMLFSYIFLSIKLRKLFQHSSKSEHKDVL